MRLSDLHRHVFRQVAGLMLPAWRHMPDGSSLAIEHRQLDQAMAARPQPALRLAAILEQFRPPVDARQLAALESRSPADFHILKTMVCASYYLHPKVCDALGYPGQQALPLSRGGFGAEELVMKLMRQPKCYRTSD